MTSPFSKEHVGACPHCGRDVHFVIPSGFAQGAVHIWRHRHGGTVRVVACPTCNRLTVYFQETEEVTRQNGPTAHTTWEPRGIVTRIWPLVAHRSVGTEVPSHLQKAFYEAVATLQESPNASALLSRRCLEIVLREQGNATEFALVDKIQQVRNAGHLSPRVARQLDAVRLVGNRSAHAHEDETSGQLLEVEHAEAEWLLEVVEQVFDEYYVQPARERERMEQLNEKLEAAGKKPIKLHTPGDQAG